VAADQGIEMKAVNLLPPDLRATERKGLGSAGSNTPAEGLGGGLAVLGLLALVLAGVVATVLVGNSIKGSERELQTVQAEQAVAQREVDTLASYGTFQALAAKRLSTVRELAAARFDWERALRDLSRAIPQDVTLDLISGSVSPTAGSGAAANPLRAAISAPAIELSGCTAGQLEVARLMARLRAVQGVSRVSLASSVKEAENAPAPAAGGATAAGSGTETKRAGCGSGAQPEFEIVIFFEGTTAAPAAPGGGAAATAAPGAPAAAAPGAVATPAPGAAATPAPGAAATPAPGAAPAATPAPGTQTSAQTTSTEESSR